MLAAIFAVTLAFVGIGLAWLAIEMSNRPLGYIGFVVLAGGLGLAWGHSGEDAAVKTRR